MARRSSAAAWWPRRSRPCNGTPGDAPTATLHAKRGEISQFRLYLHVFRYLTYNLINFDTSHEFFILSVFLGFAKLLSNNYGP